MNLNISILMALLCSVSAAYPNVDTDIATAQRRTMSNMPGATPAEFGAYPYMTGLLCGRVFSELFCGSSIISTRTLLTAAHCIDAVYKKGKLYDTLLAKAGTDSWEEEGIEYKFSHNITHPNYSEKDNRNDLGVLITTEAILVTTFIRPVKLDFTPVDDGVKVKIAGWGLTWLDRYDSYTLVELNVTVIGNNQCAEKLDLESKGSDEKQFPFDPSLELCTFHPLGHCTCAHDSGSPLVRLDNNKQVGLVSWGYSSAVGAPDVYVRISAYKGWLEYVIG